MQEIAPVPYGDIRCNNVDVTYGFALGGESVDLAVFSDRENDVLALYKIDASTGMLSDVTSANIPDSIFGVDDGSHTAYGLCTYTSLKDGKQCAFATKRDGAKVAQLELYEDEPGKVNFREARMLDLPVPGGEDPEDYQSEGIVADREQGVAYLAIEDEGGLYKFAAEVDAGDVMMLAHPIDASFWEPDIEGLTIYYGPGSSGYLLVSSQGDSSYVVLERSGSNAYLGKIVVTDNVPIDQANESDGADVLNVALEADYPKGLWWFRMGRTIRSTLCRTMRSWRTTAPTSSSCRGTMWPVRSQGRG